MTSPPWITRIMSESLLCIESCWRYTVCIFMAYTEKLLEYFILACLHRNFISNRENPQSLKHVSKFRLVCSEMKRTQCVIILYENQQQHNITTHTHCVSVTPAGPRPEPRPEPRAVSCQQRSERRGSVLRLNDLVQKPPSPLSRLPR